MRHKQFVLVILLLAVSVSGFVRQQADPDYMLSCTVDPAKQDLQFYWKDDSGKIFGSIQNLRSYLERRHRKLTFAMNGGMYKTDFSPLGLFIQGQRVLAPLNRNTGYGNFYLKPNGVLYITTRNEAVICQTADVKSYGKIKFATQSGPMLVIDGVIHPALKQGSTNLNIRNGVGVLPDNKLVFAMSKEPVNFYDLALYFKNLGCRNALYLDGFVSRTYLPEKNWVQTDGNFGVIIGVTANE